MTRSLLLCGLMLMLMAGPVPAEDSVAIYRYANGETITLSSRDDDNIRMDFNENSYMLLRKSKVYSVNRDDDGKWNVLDMDQLSGMGGFMAAFGAKNAAADFDVKMKKTGRREVIAGFAGQVYTAVYSENGQVVDTKEVVLCNHPEINRINEAWVAMASRMGQMMGADAARSLEQSAKLAKANRYGGMLRVGDEMTLQSLDKMSVADFHYALPSDAEMVEVGLPPRSPETTAQPAGEGNAAKVLSQDARDVGESAHQEAKQATIDEVKEGVQGLLKGLFN